MLRTFLLVAAACAFATIVVRHGPLEPNGWGERLAIAAIWVVGLALVIRSRLADRPKAD